ncbi:monocarboxylate transporter 13-like [Dermacentor silvarum]|uniref:monocarboxylate transporter 13-like n=1 Tax=Dermacentor silvarum TaxID=543639 RepID=UPI0021016F4F|nr:monocarboxylate transporter 13-like [Dermacentor silvarum]
MALSPQRSGQTSPDKDKCSVPADKCWGVPMTMSAAVLFLCMPCSAIGVIFVLIIDRFGVTREVASWPESLFSVAGHSSGLVVCALQCCLKTYHIILLGTVLVCFAMVASAFAPNILWMTVTFGAIQGLGFGMFSMSVGIYILLYFDKYRSIAMSFVYGAWGVSGIFSQYMISLLTDAYGLQGAFLLLGGILLHSIPIVMLAKNPQPLGHGWKRTRNACASSTSDVCSRSQPRQHDAEVNEPTHQHGSSTRRAALIFGMPAFYAFLMAILIGDYTSLEFPKTIVDYGIDKGLDRDAAGRLLTFSSVGQLFGRVAVSILADVVPSFRGPLYGLSFLTLGACFLAMPHAYALSSVAVLSVLQGIAQGYVLCIKYVLVAEYVGVEKTPICCGIAGAVVIPLTLVSPLVTGYFRDTKGTYDNYYRIQGSLTLVAALVFATFYLWNRGRRQSIAMKESEETSPRRY